ncbi:MAG: hypothetical protein EA382_17540 [Spirochaetaceae bacterium]|nr:MAG: hypothetical protein EA382_17540 [Spirochaetaceae bacterium]
MIIQINSDSNIEPDSELTQKIDTDVADSLERFGDQITRVEVHLSDENSEKKFGTEDKRCLIEARIAGLQPLAVSDEAATFEQAVDGAIEKLMHSMESTIGKRDDQKWESAPTE